MSGDKIVAIVGILMVLAINWRALQSHSLSGETKLRYALIWGSILLGLVFIIMLVRP